MANYNKVLLMGNLTRDVELKYTTSNLAIAKFGLAVNRRYSTKDGEQRRFDYEGVGFTHLPGKGAPR